MKLENAEERSCDNPSTFEIPSREDREGLRIGDLAKLVFVPDEPDPTGFSGERMWVKVKENRNGRYIGTLSNRPTVVPLTYGDEVEFGPEHVINIDR